MSRSALRSSPLSATLEASLRVRVKAERDRRWQEENREGIEQYNAMIERYGVFSEDVRLF
jgi:post-segregation antitoxin (ccd killing protein)